MQSIPLSLAKELDPSGELLKTHARQMPGMVAVAIPTEPEAHADYILENIRAGRAIHHIIEDYVPLPDYWREVVQESLDIQQYVKTNPEWQERLKKKQGELGRPAEELVFLPMVGRLKNVILVADGQTGRLLDHLDIPYDSALARKRVTMKERLRDL
jgi:hypothetical protein